uniref:NBS-LRR type resistance protein n=1 Tax=Cucumis melo TaxID=3656 RepID=A0A9I9E2R2_CUCME
VERTHQSRDPEGCTYKSSDLEGYTYQSSDPEGCTYQSSDPEGCTYQSSDSEGCTYQSSDPEGILAPLHYSIVSRFMFAQVNTEFVEILAFRDLVNVFGEFFQKLVLVKYKSIGAVKSYLWQFIDV